MKMFFPSPRGERAQKEALEDQAKSLDQLHADVLDETGRDDRDPTSNLNHALKRLAGIIVISAKVAEKSGRRLERYTVCLIALSVALVVLTIGLFWLTFVLVFRESNRPSEVTRMMEQSEGSKQPPLIPVPGKALNYKSPKVR